MVEDRMLAFLGENGRNMERRFINGVSPLSILCRWHN